MVMRKNYQTWLLGALVGGLVLPFAGCSNEDDPTPNGPGSGETVKAQFAINIPYAKKAETKMSGENTQQGGNFLGMKSIRLVPYVATNWSTSQTIDRILALDNISAENVVSGNETQKIYSDVDIPVGTDHFLFYGEANPTTPTNVANGTLTAILDGQTSRADIKFKLVDIFSGTSFGDAETALLTLLNNVENATDLYATWASYSKSSGTSGDKLVLKQLYNSFIEMEAGSANSILKLMQSLYTEVSKIRTGTTEGNVAASIKTAITTAVTRGSVYLALTESEGTLSMTFTDGGEDISNFPANLNLPDGAARVTFDFDSEDFILNNFSLEVGDGTNGKLKIENLTYPSSLYYFVESDLKASADASAAFPSNGSWDGYTWEGKWTQTSVEASTKTIAMTKPVQYGVGLLEATVKVGSDGLIDNGGNTVNIGSGFELTGVLIGGQPNELGWNMYSSSATWSKVIYDAAVPANTTVTETASSPNYTLALDNSKFDDANGTTRSTTQDVVNIVIELKNRTGKNIVGQDGTIFPDAKFYLVAQLDPASKTVSGGVNNPSVFMQDYKTTANLTITSLKNAYNTIPDLGSSSLRFGLAVDLEWKSGIVFDDVVIE